MVKCPFCGTNHVANTIFCSECGTYLLKDEQRKTDPLADSEVGVVEADPEEGEVDPFVGQGTKPVAIRLKIGPTKREVEMQLERVVNIGRVDPRGTIFPEIDLTDEGDRGKSVSRRHARIFLQNNLVNLEDLGSINGTFVNGRKLDPYMPEALKDGDMLQLGRIPMEIKILHR